MALNASYVSHTITPVMLADIKCNLWIIFFSNLLALRVLLCKQVYCEVRKQDYIAVT